MEGNRDEAAAGSDATVDVGVLFVHGIGEQAKGTTLLTGGDALVGWVRAHVAAMETTTGPPARVEIEHSVLNGDEPAHARVRVETGSSTQRWLLAESWWAKSFVAPSFSQVLSWGFRVLAPLVVAESYRLAQPPPDENGKSGSPDPFVLAAGALVATLGVVALALLLVLSLVPIARVRSVVGRVQLALTGSLGDSVVLDGTSINGAAMLAAAAGDLAWMRAANPARVVVVAHSQGAAVAHGVLSRGWDGPPLHLVTYGSGINKLLRVSKLTGSESWRAFAASVVGVVGFGIFLALQTSTGGGFGWLLAGVGAVVLAGSSLVVIPRRARGAVLALVGLAMLIPPFVFDGARNALIAPATLLLLVYVLEGSALSTQLALRADETALPIDGWDDLWSTWDLVPTGALEVVGEPPAGRTLPVGREIVNQTSLLRDHSAYWANGSEFLPRVARIVAGPQLSPDDARAEEVLRSRRRVANALVYVRGAIAVVAAVVAVAAAALVDPSDAAVSRVLDLAQHLPLVDVPDSLDASDGWQAKAVAAGAVLVLAWVLLGVVRRVWLLVDAAAGRELLRDGVHRCAIGVGGGRTIDVIDVGPSKREAIVFHSGTPVGLVSFGPLADAAAARGVRLITTVRPGYNRSTPQPGRSVADVARDIEQVIDELGVDRYVAIGHSGGGPHALACRALDEEHCKGAVVVAGVAPFDAEGLDFLAGMGQENLDELGAAIEGEAPITEYLGAAAPAMADVQPDGIVEAFDSLLPDIDRALLRGDVAELLAGGVRAALCSGIAGWRDDDLAFVKPWGFDAAGLTNVSIWQGSDDLMVPFAHGEWLAGAIPAATAHLLEGEGHLSVLVGRIGDIVDEAVALLR